MRVGRIRTGATTRAMACAPSRRSRPWSRSLRSGAGGSTAFAGAIGSNATAFAARPAASPGFIDFDVLAGPAADPVLIRAHHPRAELVEDLERGLVARQAKLSPKLHGRHAGCLAGHQIGRPKPYAQRRVRARHDRSHRQSGVTAALAAAQDARTICEAERLSRRLTMGANKPVAPASLLQVGGAGRVVGKKRLHAVAGAERLIERSRRAGRRGGMVHDKVLVASAVEVRQRKPGTKLDKRKGGRYAGRVRLAIVPDRSAESLCGFVECAVVPGTSLVTDDWSGYASLAKRGYKHHRHR